MNKGKVKVITLSSDSENEGVFPLFTPSIPCKPAKIPRHTLDTLATTPFFATGSANAAHAPATLPCPAPPPAPPAAPSASVVSTSASTSQQPAWQARLVDSECFRLTTKPEAGLDKLSTRAARNTKELAQTIVGFQSPVSPDWLEGHPDKEKLSEFLCKGRQTWPRLPGRSQS